MASKQEIQRMVEGFGRSGLTRRAYCEQHNIPISTLDYWRRAKPRTPRLLEVAVEPPETGPGFTLRLANGRSIESSWRFAEEELARLIRIAERA